MMKRLFTCLFLFTLISFPLFSGDNQSTKEEKPNTFTYKPFETNAKGMAIVPAKKLGVWNQSVRVALVVGVSAYPSTSGLSSLKFGAGDSKQMAEVLRQVGKFGEGNIIVLNDDLGQTDASLKPTKENILRAFKTLVDKRPEVFLFYFSGHGFEINNENVVAPLDALMGKASDTPQNVLNVTKEIIEKATLKDVRQTMVFLDACRETLRAGKAGGGKSFSADFLPKSVKEGQGVGVLVGTNPGGYSYEDPDLGGGVFTHFLIKGISGEVQNRGGEYVTFNDLKTYVEEKMKFYTRNTKDRHEQIPYFKGDLTGDFLIAVGRPDKTFRVVSRKFRNSVGLAIDAKVLLDGQNRMQRLSFHSITEGGEILPNNLDGISYMIYEHSKDTFVSKQFNAEGELEFVHGVKKTEKGWEIKRVYQADESGLIRNAVFSEDKDKQSGILYQRLEFDFNGNPILNEYQGKFIKSPDGVFIPGPLEDKEGISRIVQNFDLLSNKTLEEYYNASRELKPNKFGIARSVYAYDSYGNPLLVSYLNEKSRRAENEYGISNISYVYDYTINSMGILLQKESFDKSEKLKSGKEGISRFVYKYNKACLEKERKQRGGFDTHYKEWGLDRKDVGLRGKRECLESEEYFETEDKRRARDKRIASRKYSYNQEGYLIGEAYESVLSEPTPVQQGISQVKYTYNENCLLLTKPTDKCSFLDTPCMEKERKEDTTCIQKIEYFGELKDAPASDQYGVAVYEYEYDKNCLLKEKKQSWKNNETLTSCRKLTKALSAGGKETTPTIEPYTYTQYDERGDVTLKEYYDKDGKLKEDENGIARYVFRYDERGNLTLIEYYDKNGKLKEDWRGIARFFYRYNERGKQTLTEYYDKDGKLKEDGDGTASSVYQYDERGNNTLTEYYDKGGKLKGDSFGIARYVYRYDERGNRTLEEYYDKEGKLKEDNDGIARYVYRYDERGNRTLEESYDKDGKLKEKYGIARFVYRYNERGNKTLTEYYDKDGKLKEDGDGIARFVYRYEEKGNKTLEEYYDKDGKLKEDRDGIARKVYRYNEKGNLTLTEYYDKEGKLKEDSSGIARKVYRYDEKGNKTLEEYYDKEGKLKEDSEGIARKVYGYNERRYTTLEENYDKDGNLKENEDGIAGYVYRHDERGSLTLIEYYDKERKLKEDKYSGIARKVYKYDEKGNKTLEENYGKEGKLKGEHRYGIARKIFQYDEKEIFELCFNEEEIEVSQNGRNIDKPGRFWFSPEQNYVFQENLEKAFEERWVSRPESKHRTEEAQAEGNSEDSKQSPPKKDKDMVKEKIEYYVVTGGEHHIYFDYEWQGKKRKVDVVTDKFYRPVKLVFRD